ncbi:MAG: DNA primase [Alphaproteobacteria bacterium]
MDAEFQIYMDRLRQSAKPSDFVRKHVRLTRRGREWAGLCPFHHEKTPSFYVNDEKQFFHCFGCGAHGDAIGFLMQREGLDFINAVRQIARESGLPPPPQRQPKTPEEAALRKQRLRLSEILEHATQWYSASLFSNAGKNALTYLKSTRGCDEETLYTFRLGYAPPNSEKLFASLKEKGCSEDDIINAGLAKRNDTDNTPRGFFRNRIIFPIGDPHGRIIAFGARALDASAHAKYLNSQENTLFRKRETLYNLERATPIARKTGTIHVVEGYMDVIALTRAGIENVIAPLGTAISEDQLRLLWRYADEPTLCLDGDASGQRAAVRTALRAAPLLKAGKSLSFAILTPGQDPDSLIQSGGVASLRNALRATRPLADVLWQELRNGREDSTPERKAAFQRDIRSLTQQIEDPLVRSAYERDFKERLWRELHPRRSDYGKNIDRNGRITPNRGRRSKEVEPQRVNLQMTLAENRHQREARVLEMALAEPWLLAEDNYAEKLARLPDRAPDLARLRRAILDAVSDNPDIDKLALYAYLEEAGFSQLLDRCGLTSFSLAQKGEQKDEQPDTGTTSGAIAPGQESSARGAGDVHKAEVHESDTNDQNSDSNEKSGEEFTQPDSDKPSTYSSKDEHRKTHSHTTQTTQTTQTTAQDNSQRKLSTISESNQITNKQAGKQPGKGENTSAHEDRKALIKKFDIRLRLATAGERQFISLWRNHQSQHPKQSKRA